MVERPMGVLESLGYIEAYGDLVLTKEDQAWAAQAAQRRGCRLKQDALMPEDRERIVLLGKICKHMREMVGIK